MKTTSILAGGLACLLLLPATPAHAQYMTLQSGKPNIEVDMSVLDGPLPAPAQQQPNMGGTAKGAPRLLKPVTPYQPTAPATADSGSKRILKPKTTEMAPPPIEEAAQEIAPAKAIPPSMGEPSREAFVPPIVATQQKLDAIVQETRGSIDPADRLAQDAPETHGRIVKPLAPRAPSTAYRAPVSSPTSTASTATPRHAAPMIQRPANAAPAATEPTVAKTVIKKTPGVVSSPVPPSSSTSTASTKQKLPTESSPAAEADVDFLPPLIPTTKPAKQAPHTPPPLPTQEKKAAAPKKVETLAQVDPIPTTPTKEEAPAASSVPSLADLTLLFSGNASDLTPALQQQVEKIVKELGSTQESRLQIRAYATGEDGSKGSARRIALSRALAVRSYLMDKGVQPSRVDVRALGSETDRSPLDRVDMVFVR